MDIKEFAVFAKKEKKELDDLMQNQMCVIGEVHQYDDAVKETYLWHNALLLLLFSAKKIYLLGQTSRLTRKSVA